MGALRPCLLLSMMAACDLPGSGRAQKVGEGPEPEGPLQPETDGPSCAEVTDHLSAGLSRGETVRGEAGGRALAIEVDVAKLMREATWKNRRQQAWSAQPKRCVLEHEPARTSDEAFARVRSGWDAAR